MVGKILGAVGSLFSTIDNLTDGDNADERDDVRQRKRMRRAIDWAEKFIHVTEELEEGVGPKERRALVKKQDRAKEKFFQYN